MSIGQVGILNYFLGSCGRRRATSIRVASKAKALRMIFAGRLGSTPAIITLPTANNRNVFIIFPPARVTASPVMYTPIVGINVYQSSRNFKLFFGSRRFVGCPSGRSLADLGPPCVSGSSLVAESGIEPGTDLRGVGLVSGREIFPETTDLALPDFERFRILPIARLQNFRSKFTRCFQFLHVSKIGKIDGRAEDGLVDLLLADCAEQFVKQPRRLSAQIL